MGSEQAIPAKGGWALRVRFLALTIAVVLAGGALATWIDYRREYATDLQDLLDGMQDDAEGLRLARLRIADASEYQGFVESFNRHMNEHLSPGHGIVLIDAKGHASGHAPEDLETLADVLRQQATSEGVVRFERRDVAWVRVEDPADGFICVTQFTDPVDRAVAAEVRNRELTAFGISAALVVIIYFGLGRWVLRPLDALAATARAWARRDFSVRAKVKGPNEIRTLERAFNSMAAELERLRHEETADLDRARQVQRNLMPAVIPPIPGLSVVALFRPAQDVAGDLYDVLDLPGGRKAFALIDVSGHGIAAALLTGVVKMSLQRRLVEFSDPAQAVRAANDDLLKCSTTGSFVTACVGVYDPAGRTWAWCAAGHPGGILLHEGRTTALATTGALLGVMADGEWKSEKLTLGEGDRVFLYTDGVTEAGRGDSGSGLERVLGILRDHRDATIEGMLRAVADNALIQCADSACDDITLLGIEVLPGGRGGHYYVI